MYAKVVRFQIKQGKREEVIKFVGEFVIPRAKKQRGFKGGMTFTDPSSNSAATIGLWETEADIAASEQSGYYDEWVGRLGSLISGAPVREIYEVSNLVNIALT